MKIGKKVGTPSSITFVSSAYALLLMLLVFMSNCIDTATKAPGPFVYTTSYVNCTGCGDCVEPCPEKAIKIIETQHVIRASIDADKCVGCGECFFHCEFNAIERKLKEE